MWKKAKKEGNYKIMEECEFWKERTTDCSFSNVCKSKKCIWALKERMKEISSVLVDLKFDLEDIKMEVEE